MTGELVVIIADGVFDLVMIGMVVTEGVFDLNGTEEAVEMIVN